MEQYSQTGSSFCRTLRALTDVSYCEKGAEADCEWEVWAADGEDSILIIISSLTIKIIRYLKNHTYCIQLTYRFTFKTQLMKHNFWINHNMEAGNQSYRNQKERKGQNTWYCVWIDHIYISERKEKRRNLNNFWINQWGSKIWWIQIEPVIYWYGVS